MRILFLSGREIGYSRNRIILSILKRDHKVKICTTSFNNYSLRIITTFVFFFYYNLFFKKDLVFVGFFGHPFVPFVRLLTKKKIVFDVYLSMYNTLVEDRKTVKNYFLKKIVWVYELISCKCANAIIVDTFQHINYFKKTYNIDTSNFRRLLIGADDSIFNSKTIKKEPKGDFKVYFHGNFIPLQGAEYIIRVAALLKNEKGIKFYFVGDGITFNKCKKLADKLKPGNIEFMGRRKFSQMPEVLKDADIGLGIFGNTIKTKLVVPNKVYELAAISVPFITADTPAVREVFTHKKDAYFCKVADPKSLANAILEMKKNKTLRQNIARNTYKTYSSKFSKKALALVLNNILESVR